jgi:peptide/nickel transport system substrate-binding protein
MVTNSASFAAALSRRRLLAAAGGFGAAAALTGPSALRAALRQEGGALTVGTVGDLLNLDPFVMAFVNYPIMETVYDQLARLDHQGQPQPALAESWETSEDGRTLTLTIRPGVTFHSGADLTAEDVVANIERAMNEETGGNVYGFMPPIDSVSASDGATVVLEMPEPAAPVLSTLGLISIIEPAGFENLKSAAAGAGPFVLDSWTPGDNAVLRKNAAYWDAGRPLVDEVTYRFYQDEASMVAALEGGLLDIAISVPPREFERLSATYNVQRGQDAANFYYLGLNTKLPPFDNLQVRQAMAHALDRETMCANVLFGVSDPIQTPFTEGSPAFFPEHNEQYPYDLERARALLAEAGVEAATINLPAPSGFPEFGQFAQILQADLQQLGWTVNIEPMDNAQWFPILLEYPTEGDLVFHATFSFAGGTQLYPTRIAGSNNFAPVDNPAWPEGTPPQTYVDGMNAANATFDEAEQAAALREMADSFMDEAWNLPIAFRYTLFASTPEIEGLDWGVYDQIRLDQVVKGGA